MSVHQRPNGKWIAKVRLPDSGPSFHVGCYDTEAEAREAVAVEYARIRNGSSAAVGSDITLSTREFAASINVPRGTLGRWMTEGLPTIAVGRTARIDPDAANAWIAEHHQKSVSFGRKGFVYFFQRDTDNAVKIGWTSDLFRRTRELRKEPGCRNAGIVLLVTFPGDKPDELRFHARFGHLRIGDGEWFRYEGELVGFIEGLRSVA